MRQINAFEFTDLLEYASRNGYDWNGAHEFLAKDLLNFPESNTVELYIGYGEDYDVHEDTAKIIDGYLKSKHVKSGTMLK